MLYILKEKVIFYFSMSEIKCTSIISLEHSKPYYITLSAFLNLNWIVQGDFKLTPSPVHRQSRKFYTNHIRTLL